MEKLKECILCGNKTFIPLYKVQDWSIQSSENFLYSVCKRCGVVFLSTRPLRKDINKYYRSDYQPYQSTYLSLVEKLILFRTKREIILFRKYKPDALNVLEVGASFGKYLYDLKQFGGFQVMGIEISSKMCKEGKKRYNIPYFKGDLLDFHCPSETFDVVVMNHVIEHLYEPDKTLTKIFKILAPRGLFLIKTPNVASSERSFFRKYWMPFEAPRHTVLFSGENIKVVLEKYGFKVISIAYEKTPNNIILSLKNYFIDRGKRKLAEYFNLNNYLLLVIFFPLGFLLGLLRTSGRMVILAQRPSEL